MAAFFSVADMAMRIMKHLHQILAACALTAISLIAKADGYLEYYSGVYADNAFDKQSWNQYMAAYGIPIQTGSSPDRDWVWIAAYQHCTGLSLLQTIDPNGKRIDLMFDMSTDPDPTKSAANAEEFQDNLNRAIYPLNYAHEIPKAEFDVSYSDGIIKNRIAIPYLVKKDAALGIDAVEMFYINADADYTDTCDY
jgi:hypothetical protein